MLIKRSFLNLFCKKKSFYGPHHQMQPAQVTQAGVINQSQPCSFGLEAVMSV